jgi:hypothetical protein
MNRYRLTLIAWVILPGLLSMMDLQAGEPAPLDIQRLMPAMMIKITRLTGLGPDGIRQELVREADGVIVPIDDFSALSSRLIAVTQPAPTAFHSLRAELAHGVFVLDRSGGLVQIAEPIGMPKVIPLSGAILKLDDGFKMLGVRAESPARETHPRNARFRECADRGHDD